MLNPEGSKDNIIVTLATDVVLLLTMLVGLLRMGQDGTTLGLFLWRQAGSSTSRALWSLIRLSCQGLIWLLMATISEVPPAVSPTPPLVLSYLWLTVVFAVGVYQLESEW